MNVYKPHSITFPTDPVSHVWQINGWRPSPGFTQFAEFAASGVVPLFLGTHHRSPMAEYDTPDLDRIIGLLDATYKIFAGFSSAVLLKWLKKTNLGVNEAAASTVHQSLSLARSLMTFESLSAQQDQLAIMTMALQAIEASGGGAAPVVATNATLVAPSACNLYSLGPTQINTSAICVDGVTLNNNLTKDTRRCSNSIDPTFASIDRIEPSVVLSTPEVDDVMSFFVTPGAVTSFSFFLRKKSANGINVADATAEHIRFAATAGSAAQTGENEVTIRLGQSMAITTGIAIT
jgi:hypothetical protein